MLFNSYSFLFLFAPAFYFFYWKARSTDARKWISLVASYVFYGVWSWTFAALMLATTSVDYFTAQRIEDATTPARRKTWLAVSLVSNLGTLAVFKYFDFFAESLNAIVGPGLMPLIHVALPIGISFYTFESVSYTIDVYRGTIPALRRFVDYGSFVTMFPRLVAGPIARYSDMATQLRALPDRLPPDRALRAVQFFALGLAKKILIADPIAHRVVDPLFADGAELGMVSAWAAALGYTAQLYFDFSGYSDMAVGLAHGMGIELPRNFMLPYVADSLTDFWRRWHISLSTWLRDYLYIPLGGNRGTVASTRRNAFLTMLLGGLWHGANWTFVAWGAYHGLGLVLHQWFRSTGRSLPNVPARVITFLSVVVGWVIFRAPTFRVAMNFYAAMFGARGLDLAYVSGHLAWCGAILGALALAMAFDTYDVPLARTRLRALGLGALLALCIMRLGVESPFLYFQF